MLKKFSAVTTVAQMREEQLLVNAKAGDNSAVEELIKQSWVPCMRVARNLLGSSPDAVDALQVAFCRAFCHLDSFRRQASFSTWVARIVFTQCMMHLRAPDRKRLVSYDQTEGGLERFLGSKRAHNNPEDILAESQVANVLRLELSFLPHCLRVPLELHYLEGRDLQTVAVELDVSVRAVKSRLYRGRKYLRDRMLRHCGPSGGATLLKGH